MRVFFIIYLIIIIYFFIQDIIMTKKENELDKEKKNLDVSIKDIHNKV